MFPLPSGWRWASPAHDHGPPRLVLPHEAVPAEFREIPTSLESIRAELNALGGLNTKEIRTLVVFLTMVTLWLGGSNLEPYIGFKAPEGFVALLGFVLLFLPGLRVFDDWKEASRSIDWGGLILIAGGISAGMLLASTGAARWIAWGTLSGVGELHPVLRVLAVIGMVELLKIFFSSNSVTGAVVMPLIIALGLDIGMNPGCSPAPQASPPAWPSSWSRPAPPTSSPTLPATSASRISPSRASS